MSTARSTWLKLVALWVAALALFKAEQLLEKEDRAAEDESQVAARDKTREIAEAEAELPEPTIWPFFLAVGLFVAVWGIILSTFLFGVGLLVTLIAFIAWMRVLLAGGGKQRPRESPLIR